MLLFQFTDIILGYFLLFLTNIFCFFLPLTSTKRCWLTFSFVKYGINHVCTKPGTYFTITSIPKINWYNHIPSGFPLSLNNQGRNLDLPFFFFKREFQHIESTLDNIFFSIDQDINRFLLFSVDAGIKPQISYTTIRGGVTILVANEIEIRSENLYWIRTYAISVLAI